MEKSTTSTEFLDGVPVQMVPLDELRARAKRLQALMREAGFDGLMATHNADMLYLSGVVQQGQVYLAARGDPLLMVRKHAGRAHLNSSLPDESMVDVRSLRQLPDLLTRGDGRPRRIGFTFDTLPVAVFNAYSKALSGMDAELADASVLFRKARSIKSE